MRLVPRKTFDNSIYRLIIRNIQGYGTFQIQPKGLKRAVAVSSQLDKLKQRVLDYLLQQQSKRTVKPIHWSIAWEVHAGSGLPHLDILIVFQKNVRVVPTAFDYLIKDLKIKQRYTEDQVSHGHVWVTPYSPKKLNKAILQYGFKEDPSVITNLTLQQKQQILAVNLVKADPYRYLQLQMLKDPLNFSLQQYVRKHDLAQYISSWSSIKTKLKDMQDAAANLALKSKKGFKYIDRALIQSNLNSQQLKVYDSWPGYQKIVDKLNQIITYGCKRPFKSKQLFLVGLADTGKTSLIRQIQKYCAVYHMDVSNWFPRYRDGIYSVIGWNQFKLKGGMSHTDLLKFLEGYPMDLQYKGGSALRQDNPLIIMTSNMTLEQHIQFKFKDLRQQVLARQNLRARIEQINLPAGMDLFMLQKLILGVKTL